ncbi:hypothetical protein RclHR1_01410024 [Rhizophagus clarus]|uniref:Uncharacterized protein n=1 Tax=Rhizophagus clarus TaxID=94130 RepID=A0A2Z6QSD5_9GLOM|nr:hypothetical protein RclHR1_01410024 [Rhizophagus clarus]
MITDPVSCVQKKRTTKEIFTVPGVPSSSIDSTIYDDQAREFTIYDIPKRTPLESIKKFIGEVGIIHECKVKNQRKYVTVKAKLFLKKSEFLENLSKKR